MKLIRDILSILAATGYEALLLIAAAVLLSIAVAVLSFFF